jgi:hypothetical protein
MALASLTASAEAAGFANLSADEVSRQAVAATGSDLGELFQYQVVSLVTVRRGASALVPILGTTLPYRRELLFNPQKLPQHPVAALRFANETGLVLERGPVTVVEAGQYRGEAIVPFTKEHGEVYVAFAVELGLRGQSARASRQDVVGLRIEGALLWTKQATTVTTTYTLTSSLGTAAVVTVEHPRMSGFDLVETRRPDALTPDWYRWDVSCPARQEVTFAVAERVLDWHQQAVLDQSYDALTRFLERRWLDRATLDRIRSFLVERQAIGRSTEEIAELQTERERIYQRQEQLRRNLNVLGTSGEEAGLRRQVFGQLQASEERLGGIDARQESLTAQIREREAALTAALAALRVEETADA